MLIAFASLSLCAAFAASIRPNSEAVVPVAATPTPSVVQSSRNSGLERTTELNEVLGRSYDPSRKPEADEITSDRQEERTLSSIQLLALLDKSTEAELSHISLTPVRTPKGNGSRTSHKTENVFSIMGVQNGDVILRINGAPFGSSVHGWGCGSTPNPYRLLIQRKNKTVELLVHLTRYDR